MITYRVPGIERLNKPVSMINLGPTPIDLVGYYRDIGLEAYMAHDYEEYNRILTCLQVRKAVANTKILILSNSEQTPASVNTSCCDLVSLFTRYGITVLTSDRCSTILMRYRQTRESIRRPGP